MKRYAATLLALAVALGSAGFGLLLRSGAQSRRPVFGWPLPLPRELSGTLGEVRGHSLHSGIDIKTRGRGGFPVFAPADGSVSRIISREAGYGNALFLTHGGGLVSVFGHLLALEDDARSLDTLARTLKNLYNSDDLDFTFTEASYTYRRGATVGYSGESGTGTPHLHYELRGPGGFQNPLLYLDVPDREPPAIDALFLCSEKDGTTMGETQVRLKKRWGSYTAQESPVEGTTPGRLFLKLACHDRAGAYNKVAVHRLAVWQDSARIFEMSFDTIGFSEAARGHRVYDISRSSIDGEASYTYFLCRRDGVDGYMEPDGRRKAMRIVVSDFAGNTSTLRFELTGRKAGTGDRELVRAGTARTLSDVSGLFSLRTAPRSLGRDTLMKMEQVPVSRMREICPPGGMGADPLAVCAVYPFDIAYDRAAHIAMKAPADGKGNDRRVGIYQFFEGKRPALLPTRYDAWRRRYEAASRVNGYFALMRDSSPPAVFLPPTHELVEDCGPCRALRFHAVDNLSGLDERSVRCYVDGEPWPGRYDRDRKWIELMLPREPLSTGVHHIMIDCRDIAGNRTVFRDLYIERPRGRP